MGEEEAVDDEESDFYKQLITKAVTLKVELRRFWPGMMKSMVVMREKREGKMNEFIECGVWP